MRTFYAKILLILSLSSLLFANVQKKELQKELQRLEKLHAIIKEKLEQNRQVLQKIQEEKAALQKLKKELENEKKAINNERFKKLAKDFENMDPEYAGEKLSKMQDPHIAAYILYNMNSRKAGEALNFVEPEALNKITKILIHLRNNDKK
ncbi:MotE family protein [Nitratiruptor sp. YY09-18]|uniref:MotE family protein n=1 Tax=Nitratiruptor sp. YY09-18 TaxID=2724901 RepID=UPI001916143A|nr:hypothetical protein [Nitratiruptor sp. YY09-18]BCD68373.1 hypothetical protein NitYY0918_C1288 [Nitratiruptor sp. YY09-18]